MQDEPPHWTWGRVMTKAIVDSMGAYSKSLFPFLPVGVAADHKWRTGERYRVIDFLIAQTWMEPTGQTPSAWRDSAVSIAKSNGVALALSLNLFGERLTEGCIRTGNQCWMTPTQVREWGRVIVSEPHACAATMWTWKAEMWSRADYQASLKDVTSVARNRVAKPCTRPS